MKYAPTREIERRTNEYHVVAQTVSRGQSVRVSVSSSPVGLGKNVLRPIQITQPTEINFNTDAGSSIRFAAHLAVRLIKLGVAGSFKEITPKLCSRFTLVSGNLRILCTPSWRALLVDIGASWTLITLAVSCAGAAFVGLAESGVSVAFVGLAESGAGVAFVAAGAPARASGNAWPFSITSAVTLIVVLSLFALDIFSRKELPEGVRSTKQPSDGDGGGRQSEAGRGGRAKWARREGCERRGGKKRGGEGRGEEEEADGGRDE
mmetsp:Transcript_2530/g.6263  ORF Transcript_2530/g.6263 Transcript_2530/m.6263 type:complete len:263 (+) Transcript_2530:2626-3414(+)